MKRTVLEIVQDILNDMDGDPVNEIGDTEESSQIAYIIRSTYDEMMTRNDAPHKRLVTTLENVSDTDRPNYLKLPENVTRVDYLAFNQRKEVGDNDTFKKLTYLHPDEFLQHIQNRDPSSDSITEVEDFGGAVLFIKSDQPPTYYTSFDDEYVVFDSWVQELTATMIQSDTQVILYKVPQFLIEDTFIPDIPAEWFPYLVEESKSAAIYKLRQVADEKAEQRSKRQSRAMSQRGWRLNGGVRYKGYGRMPKGSRIQSHLPKHY